MKIIQCEVSRHEETEGAADAKRGFPERLDPRRNRIFPRLRGLKYPRIEQLSRDK